MALIQATKWYGFLAKNPQEYFDKKCHSYNDIEALLTNKGDKILKDIKPCFENFISNNENHEFITESLADELIISDNPIANSLATEAISYAIENFNSGEFSNDNTMWYLWTDIPALERVYRASDINDEAVKKLDYSLESCALRVVSNLTSYDTDIVESTVDEFMCNVSYNDMMNWKESRESVMEGSPIAAHIGDLISEMDKDDIMIIAKEGISSQTDTILNSISKTLKYTNEKVDGDIDSYNSIVNDIWCELSEATESNINSEVERVYYSRHMTISKESYISAVKCMINSGLIPAVESLSDDFCNYMTGGDIKTNLSDISYNMDMWDRKPEMNILYTTESVDSNQSLARKMTNCVVMNASTKENMHKVFEAAYENPQTLYIAEGVSELPIDIKYFKDKPFILNGTTQKSRHELMSIMNVNVLESALLFKTNVIDNFGKISGIDSEMRVLESYNDIYIPTMESKNSDDKDLKTEKYEKKVNADKFKRNMQKSALKAKTSVSKAYFKYKNAEEDIDDKLTHIIKKCSDEVLGGRTEARRKIVEGSSFSVVSVLKTIFAGAAIFSVSKVGFFLILITRWCNSGKIKRAEKRKILNELEGELQILDQKLDYARSDGDREAVYALMRTRNNVQQAISNIKRRQEADGGIGASEVLMKRHGG